MSACKTEFSRARSQTGAVNGYTETSWATEVDSGIKYKKPSCWVEIKQRVPTNWEWCLDIKGLSFSKKQILIKEKFNF